MQGIDVVSEAVDFRSLECPATRVPMGARIGRRCSGATNRGILPFVPLKGWSELFPLPIEQTYPVPVHIDPKAFGFGVNYLTVLIPIPVGLPGIGITVRIWQGDNVEVEDVE